MFTEEDVKAAKQVQPHVSSADNEATLIRLAAVDVGTTGAESATVTPAIVVVLSLTLLVVAPQGTTKKFLEAAAGFVTRSKTAHQSSTGTSSVEQGDISIEAKNSNVQNVNVINHGGQVNVTSK